MFKKIEDFFDNLYSKAERVPPGIYMSRSGAEAALPYKMHLRVEADGSGILILNASTVLHLNQTAVELAFHLIQGEDYKRIAQIVAKRYDIPLETAQTDLEDFTAKLESLLSSEDLDPVTYLDIARVAPYSQKLSAPYRLDCALTYRLPEGGGVGLAPGERARRELETHEWEEVLQHAWQAGIPHVIFTGGEPTLREDLPELIDQAEKLGLVCGLLTDGLRLADKAYAAELLGKGLDHILMLVNAEDKRFWAALKALLPMDVAVTAHATLTSENAPAFPALLQKLAKAGLTSLSLSAADASLEKELEAARAQAAALQLELIWDLPVPYSEFNPVSLELERALTPQGAGKAWLYIEPDGDVLPAQGVNKVLGNLLTDPWRKIWKRH